MIDEFDVELFRGDLSDQVGLYQELLDEELEENPRIVITEFDSRGIMLSRNDPLSLVKENNVEVVRRPFSGSAFPINPDNIHFAISRSRSNDDFAENQLSDVMENIISEYFPNSGVEFDEDNWDTLIDGVYPVAGLAWRQNQDREVYAGFITYEKWDAEAISNMFELRDIEYDLISDMPFLNGKVERNELINELIQYFSSDNVITEYNDSVNSNPEFWELSYDAPHGPYRGFCPITPSILEEYRQSSEFSQK